MPLWGRRLIPVVCALSGSFLFELWSCSEGIVSGGIDDADGNNGADSNNGIDDNHGVDANHDVDSKYGADDYIDVDGNDGTDGNDGQGIEAEETYIGDEIWSDCAPGNDEGPLWDSTRENSDGTDNDINGQSDEGGSTDGTDLPISFGWGNGGWFSNLEIDKSNPSIIYAASDMGGVFRSDDGGDHWIDLSVNFAGTQVWNLTLSPDGNTLYAQTMIALQKSTDKGASWTPLTASHEDEITSGKPMITRFHGASMDFGRRTRTIVVDPADQNTIYIIGERGFDNHDLITTLNYLYESLDGGQSWQELSAIANTVNSLVLDPTNRSILYVAGVDGVRKSTDGGLSWTPKNTGITNLAALDMITDGQTDNLYLLTDSGFYISTDQAETWVLRNGTGSFATNRGMGAITVDRNDGSHIFAAVKSFIYESKDGGLHWDNLFDQSTVSVADPDFAYVWPCSLFRCGGPTTDIAYDEANNLLYGVGDTGAGKLDLNTPSPQWIIKHRGLNVAVSLTLAFNSKDEIYAGGADTVLMKTINGGQTWRQMTGNWPFTSNFWAWSIGLKKTAPRKIYVCNENGARTDSAKAALYQSATDGDSWEDLTSRLPESAESTKCSQVTVDRENENTVYVLLDNKGLYRSLDNAAAFTRITDSIAGIALLTFNSSSFLIDPTSPNIFYLLSKNGSELFQSTDSGSTWTQLNQPYTDQSVGGITLLQDDYHSIYISQQHRLLRSRDQAASWQVVMNLGEIVKSFYGADYVWSWHFFFSIPVYNPLNHQTYVQITPWTHDPQNLPPAGIYSSADFGDTWERKYPIAHPGGNQIYLLDENDYLYVPSASGLWKYKLNIPQPSPSATIKHPTIPKTSVTEP